MALPAFTMRQLLEAGVHFGHQSHRWNPKMQNYIYGARNNIHILDLTQTTPLLHTALVKIADTVANGGRVLFVGTKRQASEGIAEAAKKSAQYYINHRWLGGTLTNWKTISASIRKLRQLDDILANPQGRAKKEVLAIQRERDKLDKALGCSSSTPTKKRSRSLKPASSASRSSPSSTPTATRTASTSRSPVTTTPVVPSRCTAI
jgi:small subunit ribosomal protein S2